MKTSYHTDSIICITATIEILHLGGIASEELIAVADEPEALVAAVFRIFGDPKKKKDSAHIHDLARQVMKVWELKEESLDRWKGSMLEVSFFFI